MDVTDHNERIENENVVNYAGGSRNEISLHKTDRWYRWEPQIKRYDGNHCDIVD